MTKIRTKHLARGHDLRRRILLGSVLVEVAGNSSLRFNNSYTLADSYNHSFSSDATMLVSQKRPAIAKPNNGNLY